MNRFTFITLGVAIMLSMTACQTKSGSRSSLEPTPINGDSSALSVSSSQDQSQAASQEAVAVNDAFIQSVVLNFGGEEKSNLLQPQIVSLYYTEQWSINTANAGDFYNWYLGYMWREGLTYEEQAARYKNPLGEDMGWFFPAEIYEPTVMKYFDVSAEFLRSDPAYYNKEHGGYTIGMGGGIGDTPNLTIKEWRQTGGLIEILINSFVQNAEDRDMVLTIELYEGGYRYINYLPSKN